jgi:AmmeMemoRadiSam system protein B
MTRASASVRLPAVAGLFYPGDPGALRAAVRRYLGEAAEWPVDRAAPKAVIAPHAGYDFSGPVAGSAFRPLERAGSAGRPEGAASRGETALRVVLLGPSHRVPFRGIATPGTDTYATPLGEIPIDPELVAAVEQVPYVAPLPQAHAPEHSLEVELPFLQELFGDFTLLPLVVGDARPEEVAAALEAVWGGDETLIVVSSDLSHFLSYEEAREVDEATARQIVALRGPLASRQACGAFPINGLLVEAARRGMEAELLDLRSSGDTAGDRSRVVGYGAFAFTPS